MLQFARQTINSDRKSFFDDMEITHTDMCLHGERRIECKQLVLLFQECEDMCKNKLYNKELRRTKMIEILKEKLPELSDFNPLTEKGQVQPINMDKKFSNLLVEPELVKRVINVLYDGIKDEKSARRKDNFIKLFQSWHDFKCALHKRTDFTDEEAYKLLEISDKFCLQWLELFGCQRFTNYICIISTGKEILIFNIFYIRRRLSPLISGVLHANILAFRNPWKLSLQGFESFVGTVSTYVGHKTNHEGHAGKDGIFSFGRALSKKMVIDCAYMSQSVNNTRLVEEYEEEGNRLHNMSRRYLDRLRYLKKKQAGTLPVRKRTKNSVESDAKRAGKNLSRVDPVIPSYRLNK
jgi:hypothetical protein